jgi:hypothetical protein
MTALVSAVTAALVEARRVFPAQAEQATHQALRHRKALTEVEAQIPAHSPEAAVVGVVLQALRVVLGRDQTRVRVAMVRHPALADRLLLTLAVVAAVWLRGEQAQPVALEVAALEGIAVT